MDATRALNAIVSGLEALDVHLSGDDLALANPWEEIKDQLQHERSFEWPTYLETMRQFVVGFVRSLDHESLEALKTTLKCRSTEGVERRLMQRLLARGKKDRVRYAPFDFEYFCYPLLDLTVYGQVVERTGLNHCYAQVFSAAAPTGEYGTVLCAQIRSILTREQFEAARAAGWPRRASE